MKTTFTVLMAIGALMLTSAAAQAQDQVTFAKNVAPILQEHCQVCHHVGTVAPMSLVTYGEARPWAKSIKAEGRGAGDATVVHRQERGQSSISLMTSR